MFLTVIDFLLILNIVIISIGFFGVFYPKKHFLLILISIEIIFLGLNLLFAESSIYLDDIIGHIFILFILSIVACESAIALCLFTILYNLKKTIDIHNIKEYFKNKL